MTASDGLVVDDSVEPFLDIGARLVGEVPIFGIARRRRPLGTGGIVASLSSARVAFLDGDALLVKIWSSSATVSDLPLSAKHTTGVGPCHSSVPCSCRFRAHVALAGDRTPNPPWPHDARRLPSPGAPSASVAPRDLRRYPPPRQGHPVGVQPAATVSNCGWPYTEHGRQVIDDPSREVQVRAGSRLHIEVRR